MSEEIKATILDDDEGLAFGDSAPKKEFEPVDEGEYEVKIVSYEYKNNKSGTKRLVFKLQIREDVEQKSRGRYLWHSITQKEGDRAFNYYFINQLLVATKNCPDYREKFGKEFDEVLQYLIGREFRLTVTIEESVDGKLQNNIDSNTFVPSKWNTTHPKKAHEDGVKESSNLDKVDIPDSELPF